MVLKKIVRKTLEVLYSPLNKQAYMHMIDYSKERPLDINIETTTICPMSCKFCCNRIYNRKKEVMSVQTFNSIISEYVETMGGGTVGIGSMQSDFLSDPLILERMEIISKNKKSLYVHSTTPLISAARFSDSELLSIIENMDFLDVSVEGYDTDSYEMMCGVNGFNVLIAQLKRIYRLIDENSLPLHVSLEFRTFDKQKLYQSKSYKELTSMFNEGNTLDTFFSWFGSIKETDLPLGAKLLISYNDNKNVDCVVPYATLAIQTNGNVVGCGCIDWLEANVIGNINDNSLLDIWKSDKAVSFRTAFSKRDGDLPQICKECGLYTPITCFSRMELKKYKSMDGLYYNIR